MKNHDAGEAEFRAAEQAHRELEERRAIERCICDYCPCATSHPVTILVGFTPGGDECRMCPVCLEKELRRRGVKDSNLSGFAAHRETGNPSAIGRSGGSRNVSVGHREIGHGGETSATSGAWA